jgi:hypothetical protein
MNWTSTQSHFWEQECEVFARLGEFRLLDVHPEHEELIKRLAKKFRLNWTKIGTTVTFSPD